MEIEHYRRLVNKHIGNMDKVTNKRTLRRFAKKCLDNPDTTVSTDKDVIYAMIERCAEGTALSIFSSVRLPALKVKDLFVTVDLVPSKYEGTDVVLNLNYKDSDEIIELCSYHVHSCFI